jgi:hypothetical protein
MRRVVRLAVLSLCGIAGAISLANAQTVPSVPFDPDVVGAPATAPLYLIFEQGHWGLIDARGNIVLPARFDQIAGHPYGWNPGGAMPQGLGGFIETFDASPIHDEVIPVRLNGQAALALRDGSLLALGKFDEFRGTLSEDRIAVRLNGRFGFASGLGELVVPATFDQVMPFEAGFAFVRSGDRWSVIDRDGQMMALPSWDEVYIMDPSDPLAAVRVGSRWGVVDRSGRMVLPLRFELVGRPVPPLIFAVDAGQPVYMRLDGSVAFQLECPTGTKAHGFPFFEKHAAVVKCGGRWGLVDPLGKFLLEPSWGDVGNFFEGLACVTSSGKSGVVDASGQFVIPPTPGGPCEFSEGLSSFRGSNNRHGYMDRTGRIAIAPRFEGAGPFKDGIALVHEGRKIGYIDRTGAWVIAPRFYQGNSFTGPLATVAIPVSSDTLEMRYVDRSGHDVYRMRFSGGFMFDDQTLRRFSEAATQ